MSIDIKAQQDANLEYLDKLITLLSEKKVSEFKDGQIEIKIELQPKVEYYEKEPEPEDIVDDELLFRSVE